MKWMADDCFILCLKETLAKLLHKLLALQS